MKYKKHFKSYNSNLQCVRLYNSCLFLNGRESFHIKKISISPTNCGFKKDWIKVSDYNKYKTSKPLLTGTCVFRSVSYILKKG